MTAVPSGGPAEDPKSIDCRARIYFVFAIDLGFLFAPIDENIDSRREFLRRRASQSITDYIFQGLVDLRFPDLAHGRSELDAIVDRSERAEDEGGKFIWSRSILGTEAPFLFNDGEQSNDVNIRVVGKTDAIRFQRRGQDVRVFPRGVISIEQCWDFDPTGQELSVAEFILATKQARSQVGESVWSRIRGTLQALPQSQNLLGLNVRWLDTSPTSRDFIRQHTIRHSLIFLERPPGVPPSATEYPTYDQLSVEDRKSLVGVLNFTQWYGLYASQYVKNVFTHAVRNRQDEIFLTDNDASVVVLAGFWSPGDPLRIYQQDLVLATHFELCRLTHLRYLAYYLRVSPEAREALSSPRAQGRQALAFALDVQNVILRSSYDHPAENLVQHGFTKRFLAQLNSHRGTQASLDELESYLARITRSIELRSGLDLSDRSVRIARWSLAIACIVLLVSVLGLVVTSIVAYR